MRDMVRMVAVLGIICVVSALGLAQVYRMTKEPIRQAQREELLRAIRKVLPPFENAPDRDTVTVEGRIFYVGKAGQRVTGVAVPVSSAEGYGGTIDALVGVDPEGRVTGVVVLASQETPGLGAKCTEPSYLAQFVGKSLTNAHWAVRKDGGDFDQITGATITPRALVQAIHGGLEAFSRDREKVLEGRDQGAGTRG